MHHLILKRPKKKKKKRGRWRNSKHVACTYELAAISMDYFYNEINSLPARCTFYVVGVDSASFSAGFQPESIGFPMETALNSISKRGRIISRPEIYRSCTPPMKISIVL